MSLFNTIYQSVKNGYEQSWFKFIFYWTSLGQLLNQDIVPSSTVFYNTYFSSWWWSHVGFKTYIHDIYLEYQFNKIIDNLILLKTTKLFNEANSQMVVNFPFPSQLTKMLSYLRNSKLLTQDNFIVISTHASPHQLAKGLFYLYQAGILTQDNFTLVTAYDKPHQLARVLCYLHQAKILTQDNNQKLLAALEFSNPLLELKRVINEITGYQSTPACSFIRSQSMDAALTEEESSAAFTETCASNQKSFTSDLNYSNERACLNASEQGPILSLYKNNFWAHQHSSPKSQEDFGKQYGCGF